jgi:hypothetical protein
MVVAAGAERWRARTGGLVVVAFFAMGMVTGVSALGHSMTARAIESVRPLVNSISLAVAPARAAAIGKYFAAIAWVDRAKLLGSRKHIPIPSGLTGYSSEPPVALVRRGADLYELSSDGGLHGPVSPAATADLPLITNLRHDPLSGADAVVFAALAVRAEAALGQLISELRVNADASVTLCLERSRLEITIDSDRAPDELEGARAVLKRLEGRERMVAAIDLTTPGEAVVRLRAPLPSTGGHPRKVSVAMNAASDAVGGGRVTR